MPSCNPFLFASPSFFAPSQLPITGKLYDILVSRYKAVNCPSPFSGTKVPSCYESRNFYRIPIYAPKRIVISQVLNRAQRGVLRYLEGAESKEADSWYAADYRLAWQVVTLSDEGQENAYAVAFLKTYGKPAEKITWWWRDRAKLLQLARACNSSTPLLHANQAEEVLSVIPDFDYAQVSSARSVSGPSDRSGWTLGQQAQGNSVSSDRAVSPIARNLERTGRANRTAAKSVEYPDDSLEKPSADPTGAMPPKKPAASSALESGDSARPGAAGRKKG